VKTENSIDAFRLLHFIKKGDKKLIGIGMGKEGQVTRILGPIVGSPITYASLEETLMTAPGQFTARELAERYHYRSLNQTTALYGLIGDPIDRSISDITHNKLMHQYGWNAIYVKIRVKPEELPHFLPLAKTLGFRGLSVTMPLKEAVVPFSEHIDPSA